MEIGPEVGHDDSTQTTPKSYFLCAWILLFHNFFNLADLFLDFSL